MTCFHCGPSITNYRWITVCQKKDSNNDIEDSNNNNDNTTEALNNHSDNSICLFV